MFTFSKFADSITPPGKLKFREGLSATPHDRADKYRNESKSSVKSKNISEDTAYRYTFIVNILMSKKF